MEILQKPNTDYVSAPNTNKKTEHPYYQYDKDFLSTDRKVNKTVKSDQLLVTWIANEDNSTTNRDDKQTAVKTGDDLNVLGAGSLMIISLMMVAVSKRKFD